MNFFFFFFFLKFSIGTKWSWSINGKRKYTKFIESCAHSCKGHKSKTIPILNKMGTSQIWWFCGWLSITPSFFQHFINPGNHLITYSRFQSIILQPFPSLLLLQCYLFQKRWRTPIISVYISSFDLPSIFMSKVPLIQKAGNLFELTKYVKNAVEE